MNERIERRVFPLTELRAEGEGDGPKKIHGYAAVFNSWSVDLGGFRERIAPGAFAQTIQGADVRALFNHDPNYVLGRTKSGTLSLREDSKGLATEVDPPDAQWARDLVTSISRGDIDQMSFGFRTVKDQWAAQDKALQERTLLEVELVDVSFVTYPAYARTSAGVRTLLSEADVNVPALVAILQRPGLTNDPDERALVNRAIDALSEPGQAPLPLSEQDETSQEGPSHRLALLRRRLQLAAAE